MATSNSNGDLILSLNFNTKKASESITDLIRKVKTTMDSLNGKGVKSNQLINLETQAQKSIQKIEQLQKRISDMSKVNTSSANLDKLLETAERLKVKLSELKEKAANIKMDSVDTSGLEKKLAEYEERFRELQNANKQMQQASVTAIVSETPLSKEQLTNWERITQELNSVSLKIKEINSKLSSSNNESAKINEQISNTNTELKIVNSEIDKERNNLRNAKSDAQKQPEVFEKLNEQLRTEQINLSGINSQMQNLSSDSRTSTNRISQFFRNMANNASSSYSKIRKESKRTSREANSGFGQLGKTFKTSLKTLIKYGLGMRSFFFLYRKVRSAIIDSLKELASYSSGVNSTLSDTKSAATKLKNSIATAIQPIVSVLAPVLTNVANNLSSVMNSVAQFFAALTGQSVVYQALDVQESYADSLDETTENADKATKSLERYLSPLDDLNRYSENKATSSTNTSDVSPVKFTTTKVDDQFKTVAGKVKNYFKDIFKPIKSAWNKYGQGVMTSWHTMLGNIKGAIKDVAIAFKNVWTNGTGERLVGNILLLWKDILDIINAVTVSFRKAFNKNNLGEQVIQSILDNFSSLLELIHAVASDFRAIWEDGAGERIWTNILTIVRNINRIIGGFWSRLKKAWQQNDTGKKIWKEILGFVEDVSGWISKMSDYIAGWVEQLDFSPLLESLPKLISGFRTLWKVLSQKLKGVFENVLLPLAKWTIEEGLPKLIEAFADALEWLSDVLDAIPQHIWDGIAGGILAIVAAVIAGKVIYGICTTIVKGFELITANPVVSALAILAGVITGVVTAIASYNSTQWNNSSIKKETDKINEFSSKLQEASDNINNAVDTANKNVIEVGVDISRVEGLKDRLKEIISDGLITKEEFPEYQVIKDSLEELDGFEEAWSQLDLSEDKEGNITINDNIDDVTKRLDELFKKWQLVNAYEVLSSTSKTAYTTKETNALDLKQANDNVDETRKNLLDFLKNSSTAFDYADKFYKILDRTGSEEKALSEWLKDYNAGKIRFGVVHGTEGKALVDAYTEAEKSLKNYTTAQSNAETLYRDSTDAMRFLKGETSNYAGALYAVESGLISAETAYEKLGWNYEGNTVKLERLAYRQREATAETGSSAEESASKQSSSQQKIRDENNKTTANAQENSDKQKKAARETTNDYQKEVDKWTKSNEGLRVNTGSTASTVAGYFADIANAAKDNLSYNNGKETGDGFLKGIIQGFNNNHGKLITALETFKTAVSTYLNNGNNSWLVTVGAKLAGVSVPGLATGAVIPAGKPFMAMLGDQSRGRNLEAPESLIRQIVREETANNNTGNKTYTIPVQIGSKTLFTVVLDEAKLQRMQTGYNPFVKLGG